MSEGALEAENPPRSFWWWVTTIVAPLGILGGPLALANLGSSLIEWNGWIGYLVEFWNVNFSGPVHSVLEWAAAKLHLPTPSRWLSDYVTLGVLFSSGYSRARDIMKPAFLARFVGPLQPPTLLWTIYNFLLAAVFWPVMFLLTAASWPMMSWVRYRMVRIESIAADQKLAWAFNLPGQLFALTLLPFLLFVALLIANLWA